MHSVLGEVIVSILSLDLESWLKSWRLRSHVVAKVLGR